MGGHLELGGLADTVDRPLQRGILEGDESAAAHADHVVMVLAGVVALVGGALAADVDPVDEVELLQLLEGSVNGCPADRRQPPVNLQRGDCAALALKQLDHLSPSRPGAKTCLVKPPCRLFAPVHAEQRT